MIVAIAFAVLVYGASYLVVGLLVALLINYLLPKRALGDDLFQTVLAWPLITAVIMGGLFALWSVRNEIENNLSK